MPSAHTPATPAQPATAGPAYGLLLATSDRPDAGRARAERFVADVYARHYAARISHFLPVLLGLETPRDGLAGVIGARPGATGAPLFLEAYLDRPVERVLAGRSGLQVRREDLVEVGNLASAGHGHGAALITSLAAWLDGAEIPWAVFTATDVLRALFGRLGVGLLDLAPAPGEAMGAKLADWGSYYETMPRVVAARVADVRRAGWDRGHLRARLEPLWSRAFVLGCARAVRTGAA